MPAIQWKSLKWEDLDFHLPGRLVLRHNKHLQYGYTPKPDETLAHALMAMQVVHDSKFQGFNITGCAALQDYCKAHPKGNPKITGTIKVIEHTKINNASLESKLKMMLNVGSI